MRSSLRAILTFALAIQFTTTLAAQEMQDPGFEEPGLEEPGEDIGGDPEEDEGYFFTSEEALQEAGQLILEERCDCFEFDLIKKYEQCLKVTSRKIRAGFKTPLRLAQGSKSDFSALLSEAADALLLECEELIGEPEEGGDEEEDIGEGDKGGEQPPPEGNEPPPGDGEGDKPREEPAL